MYSKIPMPNIDWKKENMKYAMCFFPLVGLVIGIIMAAWMYLAKFLAIGSNFICWYCYYYTSNYYWWNTY